MKHVLFLTSVVIGLTYSSANHILSDDVINYINQQQTTWIAGRNFPEDTSMEYLNGLGGVILPSPDSKYQARIEKHEDTEDIPESFDTRATWPECQSLWDIRQQNNCGSCWAFSSAEMMTDRFCIHSGGNITVKFSPEDLIQCCDDCGVSRCAGGQVIFALFRFMQKGVVSGGDLDSNEGCKPYTKETGIDMNIPKCVESCRDGYDVSYSNDKHFAGDAYQLAKGEEQMQKDIMKKGPLVGIFDVYEDLYSYKSGVYQHVWGEYKFLHAVKIMGWGVENGIPYWTIANSWNAEWGDKGFFKMLRGQNHLNIEEYPHGGMPKLD